MVGLRTKVLAFSCKGWKAILGHGLITALYIGVGILIIIDPAIASAALALVLAAMLIAVGMIRIQMAFQMLATKGLRSRCTLPCLSCGGFLNSR